MPDMVALLVRYYSLSEESACELIAEMRDLTSLESLAGYRGAAGGDTPFPTAQSLSSPRKKP